MTGREAFPTSLPRWQARIVNADGVVCGSGVLISDRHVLTCAHVLSDGMEHPVDDFIVDFPRSNEGTASPARVMQGGWFPEAANQRDIAILEMDSQPPKDVLPAELAPWERARGNEALVFGHPDGLDLGVWTETRIVESVGERIQLSASANGAPERIERGFSGGGVIDAISRRVVGIVVTSRLSGDRIVAFMIPMETVGIYWRTAAALLTETEPGTTLSDAVLGELTQVFERVGELASVDTRVWIAERLPSTARLHLSADVPTVQQLVRFCRRPADMRILADLVRYRDTQALLTGTLEDRLRAHRVPPSMPGAEQPTPLGTGARNDLHRVLLSQPAFRKRTSRTALFDEIETWLGRGLSVVSSANAENDAWTLIERLQPIAGGLRRLLTHLPHGPEFDQLETLVDLLSPYSLLTDLEREDLVHLLRGVPSAPLADARRHAGVPSTSAGHADLPALVRAVEEQSDSGPLPRIFTFVEHLAAHLPDLCRELRIWSDRCAARQHLKSVDLANLRAACIAIAETREPEAPALVIQIAPDALRPTELFQLSAVLQRTRRPQHVLVNSDDADPLDVIKRRVDALFGEVYRELGYEPENLIVEVIVPRVLLTEAIDHWDLTDLLPVPIGSRFTVVLRSYERLRQDRLWPSWRAKWRLAQEQQVPRPDRVHYLEPTDRSTPSEIAARLRPDDKLALVCGRPPVGQADLRPHDAYVAALASGVAYMVWTRQEALAEEFRAAVEQALAEVPVRDLPRRIADWRSDVGDSTVNSALARHVSVLACDYDRKVQFSNGVLRSPSRRGEP
ncbi:trypsin-like peptidase domain-containing protein [Actinoplanes sichuanensis]|uniref:Trypsin-like peptidase domain-containing protein n=1 Tax=Actinoplanes sichuanensis TaxID=512349 RepID=A0ABW4ANC3_9ACTN